MARLSLNGKYGTIQKKSVDTSFLFIPCYLYAKFECNRWLDGVEFKKSPGITHMKYIV